MTPPLNYNSIIDQTVDGQSLVCPVCGKEFVKSQDHTAIVASGFVCSFACFLKRVKENQSVIDKRTGNKQTDKSINKSKNSFDSPSVNPSDGPSPGEGGPIVVRKKRGRPPKNIPTS